MVYKNASVKFKLNPLLVNPFENPRLFKYKVVETNLSVA